MTIDKDNLLDSILQSLDRIEYLKSGDIPNMDLYMDQVTTLMSKNLKASVRNSEDDKILTKTMINNYAKNDLLPPPNKKKYSKEHILLLIFIYYFKGVLSIGDIQKLLKPLSEGFFDVKEGLNLTDIYEEVFAMEKEQVENLKKDVILKFSIAEKSFEGANEKDRKFLQIFAFICILSFDVYVKKLLIEKLIDELPSKEE